MKLFFSICYVFFVWSLGAEVPEKIVYPLTNSRVDVVIPCHQKDAFLLPKVIAGVKKYVKNRGRIIVVSERPYTHLAEWFDERNYPFTKEAMLLEIFDSRDTHDYFLQVEQRRIGWLYQQLLKLYAPFVIPNISSNVLILDADVILLRSIHFVNKDGGALFSTRKFQFQTYFDHCERLIPWFRPAFPSDFGVSHHMLFQRAVMRDLFETVEEEHETEFWRAFCNTIDKSQPDLLRTASEYELYFNFAFLKTDQMTLRRLRWSDQVNRKSEEIDAIIKEYKQFGYDFIAFHQQPKPNI